MNEQTYSSGKAKSWRDKAELSARIRMYKSLESTVPLLDCASILDVGATADDEKDSSNFFEKLYPYPNRITALSNQDASWMEGAFEGLKFVHGDALNMPFDDNTFDLVFSNAVIEHVGSRDKQVQFLEECIRVSKKYVFITSPNKYYPIELHTALPLIHWFPPNLYRRILVGLNKPFFASEDNLNLLSKEDVKRMLDKLGTEKYFINTIRFFGFQSNILLTVIKEV